jgi:hypothetical protein
MAKRRGRGEGSIYRRKDGSWVAQYTAGDKRRYIYGRTRKDVAVRLSKAIAERDSGIVYDAENLKVADYLDRWLDSIRDTLRVRTWRRHEEITRLHLRPTIGGAKLDTLNALQVQSLYRSKLDAGLSPRTVQIIHATLYVGFRGRMPSIHRAAEEMRSRKLRSSRCASGTLPSPPSTLRLDLGSAPADVRACATSGSRGRGL